MTKRNSRLPIFFIIGYCVQLLFLLLIIEQFCRNIVMQWFHSSVSISPFFGLFVTDTTISDIYSSLSSAILWGIFYFILHEKHKILPRKKSVVVWVLFFLAPISQWLTYCAIDAFSNKALDIYFNYCYYAVPTVIIIIFFVFNILDFIRLVKLSKQEITK